MLERRRFLKARGMQIHKLQLIFTELIGMEMGLKTKILSSHKQFSTLATTS